MPPHPPRKKGPSGAAVACGVVGVVAFLAVGVVVIAALLTRGGDGPENRPIAIGSPSAGSTLAPSPAASPTGPPNTQQTPDQVLEQNPLYVSTPIPPTQCPLNRPQVRNSAQMEEFLNTMGECLEQFWAGQFQAAGMTWRPPTVLIWDSQGTGPCGTYKQPGVAAYYCPTNSTIYMGSSHIVETAGPFFEFPSVYIRLFGHEYGHHIQGQSGIIAAQDPRYAQNPTPEHEREIIRRGELQADCFAGLFINSIAGTYPLSPQAKKAMYLDVKGRGDQGRPVEKRDHGMGTTRQRWLRTGYQSGVPMRCNTWSASDADTT